MKYWFKSLMALVLAVPFVTAFVGISYAEHPTSEHPAAPSVEELVKEDGGEETEEEKKKKKAEKESAEHPSEHPSEHPAEHASEHPKS